MDEKLKTLLRLPRKSKQAPSPKERIAICNLMIGQYFKAERKRAGLSQALLAKKIGMPLSFVKKYEAGKIGMEISMYLLIAKKIQTCSLSGIDGVIMWDVI
jgi:ribosome-binding protein aMBF1 (putative translation factor)